MFCPPGHLVLEIIKAWQTCEHGVQLVLTGRRQLGSAGGQYWGAVLGGSAVGQ